VFKRQACVAKMLSTKKKKNSISRVEFDNLSKSWHSFLQYMFSDWSNGKITRKNFFSSTETS